MTNDGSRPPAGAGRSGARDHVRPVSIGGEPPSVTIRPCAGQATAAASPPPLVLGGQSPVGSPAGLHGRHRSVDAITRVQIAAPD